MDWNSDKQRCFKRNLVKYNLNICNRKKYADLFMKHQRKQPKTIAIFTGSSYLPTKLTMNKDRCAWSYIVVNSDEEVEAEHCGISFGMGSTNEAIHGFPDLSFENNESFCDIACLFAISRGLLELKKTSNVKGLTVCIKTSSEYILTALSMDQYEVQHEAIVSVVVSQILQLKAEQEVTVKIDLVDADFDLMRLAATMAMECTMCLCEKCCFEGNISDEVKFSDGENRNSLCRRCLKPFVEGGICRIPHPIYLASDIEGSFSSDGVMQRFQCKACENEYTKTTSDLHVPVSKMPITDGYKYCFDGHCTLENLADDDNCRIREDVIVLSTRSSDLQGEILALNGREDIVIVFIFSDGKGYEFDKSYVFNIALPNLKSLTIQDVNFSTLKLNSWLTPRLEEISFRNANASERNPLDFSIECPTLKYFSIEFLTLRDDSWLNRALQVAKSLEVFDSYKLWVSRLSFASNHLRSVRLHRADSLTDLELWAPRLETLNLQSTYSLQRIDFVEDHVLKNDLPPNFTFSRALEVNLDYSGLSSEALNTIDSHPRVSQNLAAELNDTNNFNFGMPVPDMFNFMFHNGNEESDSMVDSPDTDFDFDGDMD